MRNLSLVKPSPVRGARGAAVTVLVLAAVILGACSSSSSTATTTTTSKPAATSVSGSVLGATYAKSIGFPRTVQAAKVTAVKDQKDCSSTVEAVYEDAVGKTGLISDVLRCSSKSAATAALTVAHKNASIASSVTVPKELGPTAFATDNNAPEYLMVWQAGARVAITALDVDVSATTNSKSPAKGLTAEQGTTLGNAAVEQNSLYL